MQCTTSKSFSDLCTPVTRTFISGSSVSLQTPSPPHPLPTPPGTTTEIEPFPSERVPQETTPPVPKLPLSKPSSMNPRLISILPSFSFPAVLEDTYFDDEGVGPVLQVKSHPSKAKSGKFSAKADSVLNLGNALVRTEPVNTWE